MAVSPIMQNIRAGAQLGMNIGRAYNERKAGEAMGDLYSHTQGWSPDGAPQQQQAQAAGPEAGMEAGMEAGPEGGQGGSTQLPSTRQWTDMRAEAIKRAAAAGGMEAVAKVHAEIDQMQHQGFTQNLLTARELIEQGRHDEARTYLERGASFKPDFGALITDTATLKDGSQQVMAYYNDEQSAQQRAPAMMVTLDAIDRLLLMNSEQDKFVAGNWDRGMAEEKAGLAKQKHADTQEERGWRRSFDVEKASADIDYKRAMMADKRRKENKKPTASERRLALKDALGDYEEGFLPLPASLKQLARKRMAEVGDKYPLLPPDQAASLVMESLQGIIEEAQAQED